MHSREPRIEVVVQVCLNPCTGHAEVQIKRPMRRIFEIARNLGSKSYATRAVIVPTVCWMSQTAGRPLRFGAGIISDDVNAPAQLDTDHDIDDDGVPDQQDNHNQLVAC